MSNKKPKLRVVQGNKRSKGTRKKSATSKNTGLTDSKKHLLWLYSRVTTSVMPID